MDTLSLADMLRMQSELQEKYKHKWRPVAPENAHYSLLWALGEAGEVIDIFKKRGYEAVMADDKLREHFMEETADVLMYIWDMLACMGVGAEEFSRVYKRKHEFNMRRTYGKDKFS